MLFCHNIFSKKVTIKQGYLVVGEQNKSNSNAYSKEYMEKCKCIPNLVFWNSKFEDECLIEFDHTENDLSFIFNQCHFAKKLKIRNSEKRVQLRNGEVHGTVQRSSYDDRFWLWCHRLYMLLYQHYYL
jgi:hypothetical protein